MKYSTSILALIVATSANPVWAQTSAAPASAVNDQTAAAQAPAAGANTSSSGLGDIVVTAQRREERLQDVPVAVAAFDAAKLAERGVTRAYDLTTAVPGLTINRSAQTVVYFLRGVGNGTIVPASDPSVATYIDGVYQAFPNGAMLTLNNVERVEVLKGPQGTLFGRNATGGLIQVVTKTPTVDPHADIQVGYGNFDTASASAYVTGGTGIVAADLAVTYSNQMDGWGRNLFTPAQAGTVLLNGAPIAVPDVPTHKAGINKDFAIASKFVIRPTDELTIKLAGQYAYNKSDQGLYAYVVPGSTSLIVQAGQTVPYTHQGGFWDWNSDARSIQTNRQTQLSGDITYEAKIFTVHSITAYINAVSDPFINSAVQPAVESPGSSQFSNARVPVKTFSQELQLLSPSNSPFQWITGAYYSTSNTGYKDLPFYRGNFLEKISIRHADAITESYAAFAQATVALGSATKLTGGIRYTHDNLSTSQYYMGTQTSTGASATAAFGVLSAIVPTQRVSYNNVSYHASLDHHFTDDIMVFASFNTGYKAGGYNVGSMCFVTAPGNCPAASIAPPVSPEKLTSYEAGFKTELFDRRVRFNVSGFYYDYKNLQVQSLVTAGVGGGLTAILTNAAKARIKGIDAELEIVPNNFISFNGAMEILDPKFKDYPGVVPVIPNPNAPFGNRSGTLVNGVFTPNGAINAAGNDLTRASRFTATVGATAKIPLGDNTLRLNLNYSYNGGFYWDVTNRLKQRPFGLLNAEAAYTFGSYSVRVWGRNITNTKYFNFEDATVFGDRGRPAAPATYGVTLGFKI